jgi:hypothetical protein
MIATTEKTTSKIIIKMLTVLSFYILMLKKVNNKHQK